MSRKKSARKIKDGDHTEAKAQVHAQAQEHAPAQEPAPVTFALHGSLSYFSAAQLLRLLQGARATGRLELHRNGDRTDLYVEEGRTLFGRASGSTLHVGDVLVRRGQVRPEAVEFVLAIQQDNPGARIGHMLVESGALTEEQIRGAVLAVQRHIVLGVLPWRDGSFRFWPGERVEGEDVRLDLDVDALLTGVLTDAGIVPEDEQGRSAA